jgi:hypothetical protein
MDRCIVGSWTDVPGFWSVKGVKVTVLTLMMALDVESSVELMGFKGREKEKRGRNNAAGGLGIK